MPLCLSNAETKGISHYVWLIILKNFPEHTHTLPLPLPLHLPPPLSLSHTHPPPPVSYCLSQAHLELTVYPGQALSSQQPSSDFRVPDCRRESPRQACVHAFSLSGNFLAGKQSLGIEESVGCCFLPVAHPLPVPNPWGKSQMGEAGDFRGNPLLFWLLGSRPC